MIDGRARQCRRIGVGWGRVSEPDSGLSQSNQVRNASSELQNLGNCSNPTTADNGRLRLFRFDWRLYKSRYVQDATQGELERETVRTPEADVKVVEVSQPAPVIIMVSFRIPTPPRRFAFGAAGSPANTGSGSSGHSRRAFGWNLPISRIRSGVNLCRRTRVCALCGFTVQ